MLNLDILNMLTAQTAGWFGGYEVILIVVVILLIFGGKKIPELMRGIGKGVKEFKGGISEGDDDKPKNEETKKTDSK